jgi:hypothetical protein
MAIFVLVIQEKSLAIARRFWQNYSRRLESAIRGNARACASGILYGLKSDH